MLHIPEVLTPDQVAECRRLLEEAEWVDGRVTAGHGAAGMKDNLQIPVDHPVARRVGDTILAALERNPMFIAAALPLKILPPMFNLYRGGGQFGNHVDNAVRRVPGTGTTLRTDLSCTLFFTDPDEYDGGELTVDDTYGVHSVKLPAGDLILYPSSSLHRVTPVTRGARLCSFFWLQSMIRDDGRRTLLFDLDVAIQQLSASAPDHPSVVQFTSIYHNLLRQWADT